MNSFQKRFGGIGRLFGAAGLGRLRQAHVAVVGLGGVGSWAAEALARSGIGELTLVDLDDVCISNVNRQLHALDGQFGKPKVEVVAERLRTINPDCLIHPLHSLFLKSNADAILQPAFDGVIDAIDSPSLKALLIAKCRDRGLQVVTVGGAGGRRDPTAIEVADLAFTSHDRLLTQVRRDLRRSHGFPRGDRPFGIEAVLSREAPTFPAGKGEVCSQRKSAADLRLDCQSGFGTATFVTGTFGFVAASRIVQAIAAGSGPAPHAEGEGSGAEKEEN